MLPLKELAKVTRTFSFCLTWFNNEEEVIKWPQTTKGEMQAKNAAFMHFEL